MTARANVLREVPAHCVLDIFCGNVGYRVWMKLPDRSWWIPGFLCGSRKVAWTEAWERLKARKAKRKQRID